MALNHYAKESVRDLSHLKERYENWKIQPTTLADLSQKNKDLIFSYVTDMEAGKNVCRQGQLSYPRLTNLTTRIPVIARWINQQYDIDICDVTNDQMIKLFDKLRKGGITKANGERYTSVRDYVKDFKAFWNWYMKYAEEKGITVKDARRFVTTDRKTLPTFVYFTYEQLLQMVSKAKPNYAIMMKFMFDSGCRAPSELSNIKGKDIEVKDSVVYCNIRDEVSKTYGRNIKLLLFGKDVVQWLRENKIGQDDYIFNIIPHVVNRYLRKLGFKVLGVGDRTRVDDPYNDWYKHRIVVKQGLTMYDFRHCSVCYWLPRYKSIAGLKYRFGWRKEDMIETYSRYLGMSDTVTEEDLALPQDRLKTEKEAQEAKVQLSLVQDELARMQKQMKDIMQLKKEKIIQKAEASWKKRGKK